MDEFLVSYTDIFHSDGLSGVGIQLEVRFPPVEALAAHGLLFRYQHTIKSPKFVTVEGLVNSGYFIHSRYRVLFDIFPVSQIELEKSPSQKNTHVVFEWQENGAPPLAVVFSPAIDHPYTRTAHFKVSPGEADGAIQKGAVLLPFWGYDSDGYKRVSIARVSDPLFNP